MVILFVGRDLIWIKIVAIQVSNPIVSFETVAFWFKIFNKQMKQKANIISIKISKENFVNLTCFVSNKVILKHLSKFYN